jgi:hypothetical protein
MLSVASPLDVETLRAGICRAREDARVPTAAALAELYRAQPSFEIDGAARVRPLRCLDYRAELGAADQLFDVLGSSWIGVLDDASFRDACLSLGMSEHAFNVCARRSVVLDQAQDQIWFLRGTRISPITATALRYAKGLA